jgi:hypothetical protein
MPTLRNARGQCPPYVILISVVQASRLPQIRTTIRGDSQAGCLRDGLISFCIVCGIELEGVNDFYDFSF